MFTCEACGHPLNRHNPCNDVVGKGEKAQLCGCPQFQPADLQVRVASITDVDRPTPAALAALLPKGGRS